MVDPKIAQNRQNPQDTCSRNPGRVFSEGAEPPEAITTSRTARGDLQAGKENDCLVKKCRHVSKS